MHSCRSRVAHLLGARVAIIVRVGLAAFIMAAAVLLTVSIRVFRAAAALYAAAVGAAALRPLFIVAVAQPRLILLTV